MNVCRPTVGLCVARVVEGDLETQQRWRCEATLFERLEAAAVDVGLLSIDDEGCRFAVDASDLEALRDAVRPLNAALRLTTACASVRESGCDDLVREVSRIVDTEPRAHRDRALRR